MDGDGFLDEEDVEYLHFGALQDEYRLLEFPPHLISWIESDPAASFEILGSDATFLCTPTQTFQLFRVQCTNTLLLKPRNDEEIAQPIHCYYELVEKSDQFLVHELRTLLRNDVYSGSPDEFGDEEVDEDGDVSMTPQDDAIVSKMRPIRHFTMERIRQVVFGSVRVLGRCLQLLGALCVGTYCHWKLLDPAVESDMNELICLSIVEHMWPLNRIDGMVVREDLQEYDEFSVLHCLQMLQVEESLDDRKLEIEGIWNFDPVKIGRFKARKLFELDSEWRLRTFQSRWKEEMMPILELGGREVACPPVSSLIGLAVVVAGSERSGRGGRAPQDSVVLLDEEELPVTERDRFARMFAVKKRWTLEELTPYAEIYVTGTRSIENVLTVHCKTTRAISGVRYFVPKPF